MIWLVCGGRDFRDRDLLFRTLDLVSLQQGQPSLLIHGAARGADSLADLWARERGVPRRPFPADWVAHPKAAGPIRNAQMLREGRPDLVIPFEGGRGTADMVSKALAAGVRVWGRPAPEPDLFSGS